MSNESSPERQRGAAFWYCAGIGALIALIGIVLGAGGIWLIALGGSWYYLLAGVGLLVSGGLLVAQSVAGVWVYLLTYIFWFVYNKQKDEGCNNY